MEILLCVLIFLTAAIAVGTIAYLDRRVFRPFQRMRKFAGQVAAGNLDAPLEMDKAGSFGAFTESFDLMRSELRRTHEAELHANRSKKELALRAKSLFGQVEIDESLWRKFPGQVSGVKAQRAGIVRVLINHPAVLFADEPTGALNSAPGTAVLDLLWGHPPSAGLSGGTQGVWLPERVPDGG